MPLGNVTESVLRQCLLRGLSLRLQREILDTCKSSEKYLATQQRSALPAWWTSAHMQKQGWYNGLLQQKFHMPCSPCSIVRTCTTQMFVAVVMSVEQA